MYALRKFTQTSISLFCCLLLTACDGLNFNFPPAFTGGLAKYFVDNGSNVYFTVTILYNPTSVTCFTTNPVTMTNTGTNQWSGTADYTNNLPNSPGTNAVSCTASNAYGTTTAAVGFIELIPNVPPNLVMLSTQTICGNDGTKNFNEPLVNFVSSTYVTGAAYSLTAGTLPAGLTIDSTNGNLIGTTTAATTTVNPLKMTATTAAGVDESNNFSIQINQAACP
jgi:hypothetical protein